MYNCTGAFPPPSVRHAPFCCAISAKYASVNLPAKIIIILKPRDWVSRRLTLFNLLQSHRSNSTGNPHPFTRGISPRLEHDIFGNLRYDAATVPNTIPRNNCSPDFIRDSKLGSGFGNWVNLARNLHPNRPSVGHFSFLRIHPRTTDHECRECIFYL